MRSHLSWLASGGDRKKMKNKTDSFRPVVGPQFRLLSMVGEYQKKKKNAELSCAYVRSEKGLKGIGVRRTVWEML